MRDQRGRVPVPTLKQAGEAFGRRLAAVHVEITGGDSKASRRQGGREAAHLLERADAAFKRACARREMNAEDRQVFSIRQFHGHLENVSRLAAGCSRATEIDHMSLRGTHKRQLREHTDVDASTFRLVARV
ncbi:hypothetical protein D9M72_507550 [compost metagenome]